MIRLMVLAAQAREVAVDTVLVVLVVALFPVTLGVTVVGTAALMAAAGLRSRRAR